MQKNTEYIAARALCGVLCEGAGEYTLPDYNGDIKKILYTDARVIPSRGFTTGENIEYSGVVAFVVIYLDSEDKLTHAEFTLDYEGTVRSISQELLDFDIDTAIQGYTVRPVSPRKLSARATLVSTAYTMQNAEIGTNAPSEYEPEARIGKIKVRTACMDKSGEREYAEELCRLDGAILDEVEVLHTGYRVVNDTASLGENAAEYKGEIEVWALIKEGSGVPFAAKKKIPFTEVFFEGEKPYHNMLDAACKPTITVSSLKCTQNADDDGVAIVISVITEGKMYVCGNTEIELMLDGYFCECECETTRAELDYTELLAPKEAKIKVQDSISIDATGLDSVRNILMPTAEVKIGDVTMGDGLEITGEIRFSGIACEINELGDPVYSQLKLSVPFKENVNYNSQIDGKCRLEYTTAVESADIVLDNTDVRPMAEISFTVQPVLEKSISYVSELLPTGDKCAPEESVITVYYPDHGESLFDIAKKYKMPALRIASVNALTESVFNRSDESVRMLGIDKLIIR